jgi:DNA-3-methyladenine glycosylase II
MTQSPEVIKHLKKDKILRQVIDQVRELPKIKPRSVFIALLNTIVSQQLSVKAAETIFKRFLDLFENQSPDPNALLSISDQQLRAVGLSYQKANYLKNIAQFAIEQGLDDKKLKSKTDDVLIEYLMQIKGVGIWTVEMLLMFQLNRPDIFPKDDLGIQQGIKKLYELPHEKKQLLPEMERIAEHWRPYRTLACRYIWRYRDVLTS